MIALQCLAIAVGVAFVLSLIDLLPERKKAPISNDLPPVSGEIIIKAP
jgi:hypothetical protein